MQPKQKIKFGAPTQLRPTNTPIPTFQSQQPNPFSQQFSQQGGIQSIPNQISSFNANQNVNVTPTRFPQANNMDYAGSGGTPTPGFSNQYGGNKQVSSNSASDANPYSDNERLETRIYDKLGAQQKVALIPNTPFEQQELDLFLSNKKEQATFFKGYIDSLENLEFQTPQTSVFDLQSQIVYTKQLSLQHQALAVKVKEFMEKYLAFKENNYENCLNSFFSTYQLNTYSNSDAFTQNQIDELKQNNQQSSQLQIQINTNLLQNELTFLKNLSQGVDLFQQTTRISQINIQENSISDQCFFLYHHIILGNPLEIIVEYSDYYIFSQSSTSSPQILLQLLQQNMKYKQKFSFLLKKQDAFNNIDFRTISNFVKELEEQKVLLLKIKLSFGPPPSKGQNLSEKFKDLFKTYENGNKSPLFTKVVQGSWPEATFKTGYDQSFNLLSQYQLFFIWLKQMQEKIIDFQMNAKAKQVQNNYEADNREITNLIVNYIKQFSTEMESSVFYEIQKEVYCVAATIQNKEIAKQELPIIQILFQPEEKSKLLLGHVICQNSQNSINIYLKDKQDNFICKEILVKFLDDFQNAQASNKRFNIKDEFFQVQKSFEINISDRKKLRQQYSSLKKFYETILIDSLLHKTRVQYQQANPINIDLSEIFPN